MARKYRLFLTLKIIVFILYSLAKVYLEKMMREQIKAFYEQIKSIIDQNLSYPEAMLMIFSNDTDIQLSSLLAEASDLPEFAMFAQLALLPHLRELLLDFYQIYPPIFTKPLQLTEPTAPRTLMELFEQNEMNEILTWLKENPIDLGILDIQNQLIAYIRNDQYKAFRIYIDSLSAECIHRVIQQLNPTLIDELLSSHFYLDILINLDISILFASDAPLRVLDSLCEEPESYKKTLRLILAKYQDNLTQEDRTMIQACLPKRTQEKKYKSETSSLLRSVLLNETRKSGIPFPTREKKPEDTLDETSQDPIVFSL